jgi:hypothetical protein
MSDKSPPNAVDALARAIVSARRQKPKLTGSSTAGGRNSEDVAARLLPVPIGAEDDVLTVVNDAGDLVAAWAPPTGAGGPGALTVKNDGVLVDATVDTIDVLAPLTVAESPEDEVNIGIDVGSGAGQVAAGNHAHANDHAPATVLDSSSIDLAISGQQITASVIDAYIQALIDDALDDIEDPDEEFTVNTAWAYTHRLQWESANPGAASLTSVGPSFPLSTQGTVAAADDTDGGWVKITASSTTLNGTAGRTTTTHQWYADWNITFVAWMKTGGGAAPAVSTNARYWVSMGSVSPTLTETPNGSIAGFRYSTAAGDVNWQCVSGNSSVNQQITNSGVPFADGTAYLFRIVFGTAKVKFYIDEILVATHTTHVPASGVRLTHTNCVVTNLLAGETKAVRIGRIMIATIK